jgi:hypothetical protein
VLNLSTMRWAPALIAVLALAAAGGCDERSENDPDHGPSLDLARQYMRAAERGDVARLCELRTEGALRRWGGEAECRRRAVGLAFDPPRKDASEATVALINRQSRTIDPATARIVGADNSEGPGQTRVVIDFGKAVIEDGHAVGGEIIEMHVKRREGAYQVSHLNTAVHAD